MDERERLKAALNHLHDAAWYAAKEHQCDDRAVHRVGQGDKATLAQLRDKGLLGADVVMRYGELHDNSFDIIYRGGERSLVPGAVDAFIAEAHAIESLLWQLVPLDALPSGMADSAFNPATHRFARRRRVRKGDDVPLLWS